MKRSSQTMLLRHALNLCLVLLCGFILLLAASSARAQDAVSREYQIKAAYLYNFAKFVDWPQESFTDGQSPLVIGVFGQNPFGTGLEAIAKAHQINGRPIVVKTITTAKDIAGVHLLFLGSAEDDHVAEILSALAGTSVLTVGESDKFMAAGGMVNFVREADKVRFAINEDAVEHHGMKISAQLLKLATFVRKSTLQ